MPLVCVVEHHQKPSLNVVELLFLISFVEFGMFFIFIIVVVFVQCFMPCVNTSNIIIISNYE